MSAKNFPAAGSDAKDFGLNIDQITRDALGGSKQIFGAFPGIISSKFINAAAITPKGLLEAGGIGKDQNFGIGTKNNQKGGKGR